MKSGTRLEHDALNGGFITHHPEDSHAGAIPKCQRPIVNGTALPVLVPNAGLPSDYDGWIAYTAFNVSSGISSFQGVFSVPDIPASTPHILYLFTGLQNKDWVPKVDPEVEGAGFDIIQPVLQFPGDYGRYWSVKSW